MGNLRHRAAARLLACMGAVTVLSAASQTFVGAFDVGPSGNPQKFNPLVAPAGFSFYNKYFSTLTLYDVGLQKISGDLAEGWTYAADGRTLTIRVRPGVTWHDGKPLTARDVKFTLDLVRNPDMGSVFIGRLEAVSEIRVVDEHTVAILLKTADVTLPDAFTTIMILPEHLLGRMAAKELRDADWWRSPVGSGPFRWVRYLPDQYVELEANKAFYRGAPKLDKLVNRYFKDVASAATALQAGEIQHTYLSLDLVSDKAGRANFEVVSGPSHVLNYLGFNHRDARFQDLRVRRALLLAIDRGAIVKSLYGGNARLGQCVLTLPKYVAGGLDRHEANAARARALLQEAGWARAGKGEPLELLTYYNDQLSKDVLAAIQAMLAAVGVAVRPRFVDTPTYSRLVDAGEFTLVFAGQGNGPDPSVLNTVLDSQYVPPRGLNRMRIHMRELDRLLEAGQAELDETRRVEIYRQLCRLTNSQLPILPLWTANRFGGFARNVQDAVWTPSPGGGRYQDFPERWSLR